MTYIPIQISTYLDKQTVTSTTPSIKKVDHFDFYDNFSNTGPIFIIFSLLNS